MYLLKDLHERGIPKDGVYPGVYVVEMGGIILVISDILTIKEDPEGGSSGTFFEEVDTVDDPVLLDVSIEGMLGWPYPTESELN